MSKRRLILTIFLFILTIALVVGSSYLVSLVLNKNEPKRLVDGLTEPIVMITER